MNLRKTLAVALTATALAFSSITAASAYTSDYTYVTCTLNNPAWDAIDNGGTAGSNANSGRQSVVLTDANFSTYFSGTCPTLEWMYNDDVDFKMSSNVWVSWRSYSINARWKLDSSNKPVREYFLNSYFGDSYWGYWSPANEGESHDEMATGVSTCSGDIIDGVRNNVGTGSDNCTNNFVFEAANSIAIKNSTTTEIENAVKRGKSLWLYVSVTSGDSDCSDYSLRCGNVVPGTRVKVYRSGKFIKSARVDDSGFVLIKVPNPAGKQTFRVKLAEQSYFWGSQDSVRK